MTSPGSRDKCATYLENEIEKQVGGHIEEENKEEIEEENNEEIKEDNKEEIEEENNEEIKEENKEEIEEENDKEIEEENEEETEEENDEETEEENGEETEEENEEEIEEENEEENEEEIEEGDEEGNEEESEEVIEEETEEEYELAEQRNKKIKVTNESTDEETAVKTVEVPVRDISDDSSSEGSNASSAGSNVKCSHPVVEEAGSSMAYNYIHKDLRLEPSEMEKLRKDNQRVLLNDLKLILVLGLDHTLIHSTTPSDFIPRETYVIPPVYEGEDDMNPTLVQLGHNMLMKLRPFLRTFLKEANKLFRMYIYTTREQDYVTEVAKLLDPRCVYFPSSVICQSNNTTMNQRGLDFVLAPENLVIILDDTEHVWPKHNENLILVKRYSYFADDAKLYKSAPQTLSVDLDDETEPDRTLASVLNVLKRAHEQFFDPVNKIALPTRDVRNILQLIKMEILQDCNIVFSKVFSGSRVWPELQPLWKSAEDMGAKCFHDLNDSVTHVVAMVSTTGEVKWARENNKFVVTPQWIEAANYLWKRQKEQDFPVLDTNDQ